MREYLAYSMIMGMSAAFLWHFSNIIRFGSHYIREPNLVILSTEIVFLCACFTFALLSVIKLLRSS